MKGFGFRLTASREAILTVLTNTNKHLSAEDIYIKAEIGLQNKYGFNINDHLIRFYGTCPDCKTV